MSAKIRTFTVFTVVLVLLLIPGRAGAQDLPLPSADWQTVETEHFSVHYPSELSGWALPMCARLEAVYDAVSALVGNAPRRRITVIVDDPLNTSNGSAWPGPAIFLWPTPPGPRSMIGENRGWSEILTVHEYAHIAHFTRPSRNPLTRLLLKLLPIPVDPILLNAPRWLLEGYATYIEGRLTGSGRPHGTWRPAVLRQWALEGQLPTYEELNSSSEMYGGSMAYLAGSAFVEWLVDKKGEESLPHLWRRMTARKKRSFNESFAGVFGSPPSELYGRFAAELTGRALAVEEELSVQGIEEGEPVQRLDWLTGDPAISPDGERIAVVLRARDQPSRLVVWNWQEEPVSEKELKARQRAMDRDPDDVPAIEWRPREKKPIATLYPSGGRAYSKPRFMPDGKQLLVVRPEALADGRIRPDLFLWNYETGAVDRITRRGAIHEADPSPDGRTAVGIQCLGGSCDIVRIDLETGAVTAIRTSSPDRAFSRPRFSPDGGRILASYQEGTIWKLVVMNSDGSGMRAVGPDDGASRFDAEFAPDGNSIVCVSTRGGIPNLELLDPAEGTIRPLTRVTGAAVAPAVNVAHGSILFLNLRSRGYDLHRVEIESALPGQVTDIGPDYRPAGMVPSFPAPGFAEGSLTGPRAYGLGPRKYVVLPQGSYAREGGSFGLSLGSSDPVGRLSWTLGGMVADESAWQGGSFRLAWRGWGPIINVEVFAARQYPSMNEEGLGLINPLALDVDYYGADVFIELRRDQISRFLRHWVGVSVGYVDGPEFVKPSRRLVFAGQHHRYQQTPGRSLINQSLRLEVAVGETGGKEWNRALASFSLGVGRPGKGILSGEVVYGETGGSPSQFEQFSVGGLRPALFDGAIMSQRISMPALPVGFLCGKRYASYKGEFLIGSIFSFYYWAGMAGEELEGWEKIFGQEITLDSVAMPLLGVPGVQFRIGSGIRTDEPYPKKTRFYLGVSWRP